MTNEQIVLTEIRRIIDSHPNRVLIEQMAKDIRDDVTQSGEIGRIAVALVGAELAAAS